MAELSKTDRGGYYEITNPFYSMLNFEIIKNIVFAFAGCVGTIFSQSIRSWQE